MHRESQLQMAGNTFKKCHLAHLVGSGLPGGSLLWERRYFDCAQCRTTFPEPLTFVDERRNYTRRYEADIFEQVRQTTATYVAAREGLTDTVVKRIFVRQAHAQLPEQPLHGVSKLGIDEIAERKGRQAYDLLFYNVETGVPLEVLENRTQAELMQYLDELPEAITASIDDVCIDNVATVCHGGAEEIAPGDARDGSVSCDEGGESGAEITQEHTQAGFTGGCPGVPLSVAEKCRRSARDAAGYS